MADNNQQQKPKQKQPKQKPKKKERKPNPKPERTAPVLKHPDDGSFGDLLFNQSQYTTARKWVPLKELSMAMNGKEVWIRARVDTVRGKGNVCFLLLRHGFCKLQAFISKSELIPKEMVKYCSKLPPESIIDIYGIIRTVEKGQEIKTAAPESLQMIELLIKRIYGISIVFEKRLPFELSHATRPLTDSKEDNTNNNNNNDEDENQFVNVKQKIRLDNRWIDLRTITNHAIFRIQSAITQYFREYLLKNHFVEIHSPKLISAASEGGANVFKLKYFGNDAFLAQSPQLYKQMAICSDFYRVFEVGPVFRAEDSNTHRHLCEFTGLDLEMEFFEHYHEVVQLIGQMFIYIFNQINKYYSNELNIIRKQYPFNDLLYNDKLLILTFAEARKMLVDYYNELLKNGEKKKAEELLLFESKDFSTPSEKALGQLVKKKYGVEFYCVDKYPLNVRPFYTMNDFYNKEISNSYDFFIRGEEIMSGAQRIHDSKYLIERAKHHNIPIETLEAYINSFKYATSPHAGGGIGLDRFCMLFLGLDNVRKASLFPRDPQRCTP